MKKDYHIYPLGETAATIAFEAVIDEALNDTITALYQHLVGKKIVGVKDIIPSYHTITLVFDIAILKQKNIGFKGIVSLIEAAIVTCDWQVNSYQNIIQIPVCYDVSLGLDLDELATLKSLSIQEVIKLHTATIYRIYAIGFLPGFTYMGKVNEMIATPRKQTPRTNVARGSVGIAGEQTGIYPLNSLGGWNIIGQTPLQLFNANREEPVFVKMGDFVQFVPIGMDEFCRLKIDQKSQEKCTQNQGNGIKILKQGLADSVQDLGRYGYQHLGINPTGAMDIAAAQIANFLVGNSSNEAVIELHFPTSIFQFQTDAIIALSGANFTATINDINVPINTPIIVAKDAILRFIKLATGVRCYLAVAGGYHIKPWLNSCSTNLKANVGGYYGRLLQKDDMIEFEKQPDFSNQLQKYTCVVLPWHVDVANFYKTDNTIHILSGNEQPFLCGASKEILLNTRFVITNKSDRMGYRLHGLPMQLLQPLSLISTAVTKGTIQLLPDGELIILMADHQTIGGYPRVGHVAQKDMPTLAQIQVHQPIKFQLITHQYALDQLQLQQQYLLQIQNACIFKLKEFF